MRDRCFFSLSALTCSNSLQEIGLCEDGMAGNWAKYDDGFVLIRVSIWIRKRVSNQPPMGERPDFTQNWRGTRLALAMQMLDTRFQLVILYTCLVACLAACAGRGPTAIPPAASASASPSEVAPPTPKLKLSSAQTKAIASPYHPAFVLLMAKRTKLKGVHALPCTEGWVCKFPLGMLQSISEQLSESLEPDAYYAGRTVYCFDRTPIFRLSNMDTAFVPPTGFSCEGELFGEPEDPSDGIEGRWELQFRCTEQSETENRCRLTYLTHNGDESSRTQYSFRTDKSYSKITNGEVGVEWGWPDFTQ